VNSVSAHPILLVEDDASVRRFLRTALAGHGHATTEVETIAAALAVIPQIRPSVMLLDLGLPDGDGLTVLRMTRPEDRPPTIVLSARGQEDDKIAALDAGADDYLTKPFGTGELLARIRVVLRRRTPAAPEIVEVGPIRIDRSRHEVTISGRTVHLTPIEFNLLVALAASPGRVFTHRQLLLEVWGPASVERANYLRVHMAALRRKVETNPAQPQWLQTETGVGYRMREPSSANER
jgi:two-component system KDP operon response regulator KdpE